MSVLVSPDSFKGTLSAQQVAATLGSALRDMGIDPVVELPLADGGEGTAAVLGQVLGAAWVPCEVTGPFPDRRVEAGIMWVPDRRLAMVDMAAAAGLTLLRPTERNPLVTTTVGVGELIAAARDLGAEEILLGAGGSSTVDGGLGMATALGWTFDAGDGSPSLRSGQDLRRIRRLHPPHSGLPEARITVLCDVDSVLLGEEGCVRLYAPQKGADEAALQTLEVGMEHLVAVVHEQLGLDMSALVGGGASGGLAAGAWAFLGAKLCRGIDVVCERVGFDQAIRQADWVIGGEGCLDHQSLRGKVLTGVLDRASRAGARVAVIAGRVELPIVDQREAGIEIAVSLTELAGSAAEAEGRAVLFLERAAEKMVQYWNE